MIARLGQEINHPDSIYYWAWKNDIPVFCPALTGEARRRCLGRPGGCLLQPGPPPGCSRTTFPCAMLTLSLDAPPPCFALPPDGSLGDMLFFHSYKNPGLILDIVQVRTAQGGASGVPVGVPPGTTEARCRTPGNAAAGRPSEPPAPFSVPAAPLLPLPALTAPVLALPPSLPPLQDIRLMNDHAMKAAPRKTGAIILGGGAQISALCAQRSALAADPERAGGGHTDTAGDCSAGLALDTRHSTRPSCPALRAPAGVPKHHICNANLMKNGADFACFVNTAQEFDGSDSGARSCSAVQRVACARGPHGSSQ